MNRNSAYHIIKLESKKTEKDKDGKDVEKYSVRHILFSTSDPNPNPMAPPMSMEDKAKAAVAEEKTQENSRDVEGGKSGRSG